MEETDKDVKQTENEKNTDEMFHETVLMTNWEHNWIMI